MLPQAQINNTTEYYRGQHQIAKYFRKYLQMNKLYLRVKELAAQKHVSLAKVERDLGFSNGIISTWKTGKASQDKINSLADYFNVSTDYLLGRSKDVKDPVAYFRLDTSGLSEDQISSMKSELADYAEYLKHRVRGDK